MSRLKLKTTSSLTDVEAEDRIMDAQEKDLATKTSEEAQDAQNAADVPELPEVPAYINQQRAEVLRKQLTQQPVPPEKGLIYLASFPKSGNTWTRLFLFALFNPLARQDSNFNLSDIAGRAGQMDVTFQLFERILGKPHYEISDVEVAQTMPMAQKLLAVQQEKKVFVKTHLCNGAWHGTRTIGLDTFRTAVYIVRNPLDVTPSFASHMNTDIDGAIKGMANSTHFIGGRTKKCSLGAAIKAEKEKRPELSDEEAKVRRTEIQREADFYGAMDGASKFVKGDAVAGVVITVINIVGGLSIGVFQKDMALVDAAQTYALLTIGDGLVSQIPALLVATALQRRDMSDGAPALILLTEWDMYLELDFEKVYRKEYKPEFVPPSKNAGSAGNFDKEFTAEKPIDSVVTSKLTAAQTVTDDGMDTEAAAVALVDARTEREKHLALEAARQTEMLQRLAGARARPLTVQRCGAGPNMRPMSACIIARSIPAATRIPSPTTLLQKTLLQALPRWRSL